MIFIIALWFVLALQAVFYIYLTRKQKPWVLKLQDLKPIHPDEKSKVRVELPVTPEGSSDEP